MKPVIFLGFDESQHIAPSDRCGNLGDLGLQGPLIPATAVQGWAGSGRSFAPASSNGFLAADNDGGNTLLTRDVTIQALLQVDLALSAQPMTIIARGLDGSASEYYAYGLEVQAGAITGDVDVRWFWQDQAGTPITLAAGTFTSPGDHATVLLTATRRWESTTRVVCRYYVADHLLAEVVSTDGNIGGGTTGHTSIGARKTAGTWGRFFGGVIEQLVVLDYEMCAEEIEARWRRMTVHQPQGVARWRAMQPPGAPWSRNPDAIIARLIKVWGQLGGIGAALAEEVRNLLPDRAYLDIIKRWERLVGLSPRPLDSLDTRRARVLSMLQRENGFSLPILRAVLAPLFDLDAANVEILEFTNRIVEPFDDLKPERWTIEAPAGVTWSATGGVLRCVATVGANISPLVRNHARSTLPSGIRHQAANEPGTLLEAKIAAVTSWPSATNVLAGLYWYEFASGEKLWVGITKVGADWVLAHRRVADGTLSALTSIATLGASPVLYLRTKRTSSPTSMLVQYGTAGFAGVMAEVTIPCPPNPSYVGVAACADTVLATESLDVSVDDLTIFTPQGARPFFWYAYRNPALPGAPDLVGARTLVARYRPAHTFADAITMKSFICGVSTLGSVPLGGF